MGLHLAAALPAEAAPFLTFRIADALDRGDRRADRLAGRRKHSVHAVCAAITDEGTRPDDQLLDLLLVLSAERT